MFLALNLLPCMRNGPVRDFVLRGFCLFDNVQDAQFQCLLFLAGPSIKIWRSCGLLGAMIRALRCLPGGCGRFIPCRVGANHCRLRAIGREQCGHGLTSRPLEVSGPLVLSSLVVLFGYPAGPEDALLAGRVHMRYCNVSFAEKSHLGFAQRRKGC